MKEFQVWQSYIDALNILTEQYENPFRIKVLKTKEEGVIDCRFVEEDQKRLVYEALTGVFKDLTFEDVRFKENHLLYPTSGRLNRTNDAKDTLDNLARAHHFTYSLNPGFSATINYTHNHLQELFDQVGIKERAKLDKPVYLTIEEIEKIDGVLEDYPEVTRATDIGAVFQLEMKDEYMARQCEHTLKFIWKHAGVKPGAVKVDSYDIYYKNKYFFKDFVEVIKESTPYYNTIHLVTYEIQPDAFNDFLKTKKHQKVFFRSEPHANDNSNNKSQILPDPQGNKFVRRFKNDIAKEELNDEIRHFKRVLGRFFKEEDITVTHEQVFRTSGKQLFNSYIEYIKASLPETYQVSLNSETLSFDFQSAEELDKKIEALERYSWINLKQHENGHKFKVYFEVSTPLVDLERRLSKSSKIKAVLNKDQNQLQVFGMLADPAQQEILKAKILNEYDKIDVKYCSLKWNEIGNGYLKYFLHFDEESFQEYTERKFMKLRGGLVKDYESEAPFGMIRYVNYPYLEIELEVDSEEILLEETLTVAGSLKGEKDKIKRLYDAIEAIQSDSSISIVNPNLKDGLIDSAEVKYDVDEIKRTLEYCNLYREVEADLLSSFINESQKEAIAKSLLAEDLFVVQGPPGTGKSTAIAELIWQHIRLQGAHQEKYKILVTSETNLAVDNALDKLRSDRHMLIKPIRFGSEDKLDREGWRFSLEAINAWGKDVTAYEDTLIVDDWVTLISDRSEEQAQSGYLKLWKEHLLEKDKTVREFFSQAYLKHCNVVGATCSSIGKLNSEGRFTRFFQDYCNVYHAEKLESYKSDRSWNTIKALNGLSVEFDLAIQDEASKASPPELMLPFVFTKKAIVIGDHRQLPPMIDTNEFIDSLEYLKAKAQEGEQRQKIKRLQRFIKRNSRSFEISHFERLFKGIHQNYKTTFDTQYRMHPAINETIKQFYKGDFEGGKDLECGLDMNCVDDPNLDNIQSRYHGITNKADTHVMWFDVNTPEVKQGTSRVNPGEVEAIKWIVERLKGNERYKHFVDHWGDHLQAEKELGIITFYGAQANLLKKNLPQDIQARVSPVDRFQGMERNIVIVSMVRSNRLAEHPGQEPDYEMFPDLGYAKNTSLGFAESPNRLNVALSRAKRLLIVVGNKDHFSSKQIYKNVYETILKHPQGEVWSFSKGDLKKVRNGNS
ncbi:DEAD/DEAH box helicase [Zeaxanthinibacter enoshimensis]|uniref:Superfamily I DNA and/or RNA helicase n=1 Tax=Zeaxanthinibacter enoshimensis TaxID=392009 RepID=A0A4R6TQB8_9FLAO|nr:AAA domain-containing protein [Zeaxanthinibacter enoshimensis]TDQ33380.1 superfamily I DNA and/or RNA helicase [Zeaxanthinibacter enoshimensis]